LPLHPKVQFAHFQPGFIKVFPLYLTAPYGHLLSGTLPLKGDSSHEQSPLLNEGRMEVISGGKTIYEFAADMAKDSFYAVFPSVRLI